VHKTRFAPSPTGYLHLGNARTALFNAILACKLGGHLVLRIEDTDPARSQEVYTRALLEDLRWLGLTWEEGPDVGGERGPYRQSERSELYVSRFAMLEQSGRAYPCFCSDRELALARKAQLRSGCAPRYPGTCANLERGEIAERRAAGIAPTLRFRVPAGRTVAFDDLARGPQRFASDAIGDFIIRRADGTPAFFFSNALDDALMGISHVLRGDDHLSNTPRQLLLLEALGFDPPHYGHLALLVGADGAPLSKRQGSFRVRDLREQGYLPEALVNHLARLGHAYEEVGLLSAEDLAEAFDLARLGRAPPRFDRGQLLHWQRQALDQYDPALLAEWLDPSVWSLVPQDLRMQFLECVRPNLQFPKDALHWARVLFEPELLPGPTAREVIAGAGAGFFGRALEALDGSSENPARVIRGGSWNTNAGGVRFAHRGRGHPDVRWLASFKKSAGVKGRALFQPLRAALTGELEGPDLGSLLTLMPQETVRRRLAAAQALAGE
jgi:nondiscriminating glutamyl-tRNA synthetase